MKCYIHQTIDAIGLCKSCGRGLCPECITEIGTSCACKNRCEQDVESINEMLLRGRTVYNKTSSAYNRNAIFLSVLGASFVFFGLYLFPEGSVGYFFAIFGGIFIVFGISQFLIAKKFKDKNG